MSNYQTSIWIYPWDMIDEGIGPSLDMVQQRGGIQGVNIAMSYHSGMFLLPHNPRRKLYYPTPGVYFDPDQSRYAGLKMQPIRNPLASPAFLVDLRKETSARGMEMNAWAVCMHNSGLGTTYPDSTMMTPFGDRIISQLCPANPSVRSYILALAGDLLNHDFDRVVVESLEYMSLRHGYHHEVVGVPLTAYIEWLMGLCFCEHCRGGAIQAGVDIDLARSFVCDEIQQFFTGKLEAGRERIGWPEIKESASGELGAFHQFRIGVVTSIYQEISATHSSSTPNRIEACDFGPLYRLGPDGSAWESGFDLKATAPYINGLHPCFYHLSMEKVAEKTSEYLGLLTNTARLSPAIRAIPPQVITESDLVTRLNASCHGPVEGFSFYNYGVMRLTTLDWIKKALADLDNK
jgi:hypothetical protein